MPYGNAPSFTTQPSEALDHSWRPRASSNLTSRFVTLNPARQSADAMRFSVVYTNTVCTHPGLEPVCSSARAATGGDHAPGRGSPLTRWRPPTVQFNAQSSARELENAS